GSRASSATWWRCACGRAVPRTRPATPRCTGTRTRRAPRCPRSSLPSNAPGPRCATATATRRGSAGRVDVLVEVEDVVGVVRPLQTDQPLPVGTVGGTDAITVVVGHVVHVHGVGHVGRQGGERVARPCNVGGVLRGV